MTKDKIDLVKKAIELKRATGGWRINDEDVVEAIVRLLGENEVMVFGIHSILELPLGVSEETCRAFLRGLIKDRDTENH